MIAAGSDLLHNALAEYFGFDAFKGDQEKIIKSLLNDKDTLVIMPTGGGKSLCYQLPAIMQEGTALIISPLIALMKNQVDLVRGYSSNDSIAHYMNSSLSRTQLKQVHKDLLAGETKLLYVAPETLTKAETIALFQQLNISFVAVDEAHCISEWGHDFRPEYRRIREMVDDIKSDIPIIALTATATPKVRTDIIKNLKLQEPDIYISSFNRTDLYYDVRPKGKKDEVLANIVRFIKKDGQRSGIIYCLNRKTTEELAEQLVANGIKAAAYHAGLDSSTRSSRQDQFLSEDVDVIVATIAFGMGIDKPDVRFVIHYNMPKSLENYYQETGRAGRDGMGGTCLGFFNYADMTKLEKFMRDKKVSERDIGAQHIAEVTSYAETAECRRRFLLHYFGEDFGKNTCDGCDNCRHPKEKVDVKEEMVLLIKAIQSLKENYNAKYVVSFLRGTAVHNGSDAKIDSNALYGAGKAHDDGFWNSVITQATIKGWVRKDIEHYGVLRVQAAGEAFLKTPSDIQIALNHDLKSTAAVSDTDSARKGSALDPLLLGMLKDLRKEVAKRKKVPTYVVFQDRSLEEMATFYPINSEELESINGVNKGKIRKYGKDFLELIGGYVEENDIERLGDVLIKTVASKSKSKVTIIKNIDLKISFDQIARDLSINMEELLHEIETILDSGMKLNIDYHINDCLDEYQQEELYDYFMEAENDSIKAAYHELEEDEYTEEDIRLMRIKFLSELAY